MMNTRHEVIIAMADGETHQEAARNAETAIRDWLDTAVRLGRTIPEPKGQIRTA